MTTIDPTEISFFCHIGAMNEYPNLSEAIAIVLEQQRRKRGITKSALADFACLDRRYLREIEVGTKKPTVNAIFFLCDALDFSPIEFFTLVCERLKHMGKQ